MVIEVCECVFVLGGGGTVGTYQKGMELFDGIRSGPKKAF